MPRPPSAGRRGHRWRLLTQEVRTRRLPCFICGQPIDYTLDPSDPESFTVDHIKPRSRFPELATDPGNLTAAHRRCNAQKGNHDAPPGLGLQSQRWGPR